MNVTEAQLTGWIAAFVWPMLRIGAMSVALPLFSMHGVPARVRVVLTLVLALVVVPLLPPLPEVEVFSYQGFGVAVQQVLIGLVAGFIIQLVFAAVIFGGQGIAYSMGLGFASLVDPQNGQQVPVVSQLYVVAGTLLFLTLDGHLVVIKMLLDSFITFPIAAEGLMPADYWAVLAWASRVFAGGLLLALPVIASLLLVNISFG
ncbi:MAG: flagellar biosynthetic protein FliR, partial [Gammaproteobacteria bacterium]